METHNIVIMTFVYSTTNQSWYTKEGQPIAPGCPVSVFGNFFGLVSIRIVLEKFNDNFDGLLAEKGPFLVKAILCPEACLSLEVRYKDNKLTIVKILSLAQT